MENHDEEKRTEQNLLIHSDESEADVTIIEDCARRIVLLKLTTDRHEASCGLSGGCSSVVVEYQTRNGEVAGSTHTRSTASNLEQVANLLCAQANSASYPQRDGK